MTDWKGLIVSAILVATVLLTVALVSPRQGKCAKWEKAVKVLTDPKSGLVLNDEVSICREYQK